MEFTYLGVVLTDDISYAKDVERAKLAFFKSFNYTYITNLILLIKMCCCLFSEWTQ